MISQPMNRAAGYRPDHQGVHPEGEQPDKGEEAGEHRLDRGNHMLVTMFGHSGAVRGQTGNIMVSLGLAPVVVAHTVYEDHEDGDRHEEEGNRSQRVDHHPDLESLTVQRQPVQPGAKGMLCQMFSAHRLEEDHHTPNKGKRRSPHTDDPTGFVAAVGKQHDDEESQQRRYRKQPE